MLSPPTATNYLQVSIHYGMSRTDPCKPQGSRFVPRRFEGRHFTLGERYDQGFIIAGAKDSPRRADLSCYQAEELLFVSSKVLACAVTADDGAPKITQDCHRE